MDGALLERLVAEAGASGEFVGGLVIALLYVIVGLLAAVGSILVVPRMFQGRWEQIFWALFLVVIAAFYLSFAAYFGVSSQAWRTEAIGVALFFGCAVGGLFARPAIAVGYVLHGLRDVSHSLSGTALAGLSLSDIPMGYGLFCLTYDFAVAIYLTTSGTTRGEPSKFDPFYWRRRA